MNSCHEEGVRDWIVQFDSGREHPRDMMIIIGRFCVANMSAIYKAFADACGPEADSPS
eukprot:gene1109-biopygen9478